MSDDEKTMMLLMYRALKIMVASAEWSCMVNEEQDEILYAIQKFEEYNRDDRATPDPPTPPPNS